MPSGFRYERKLADKLEKEGWHVERVASSGRRINSVCDLVGIKSGKPHLFEVKSRKVKVFYTKKFRKELMRLMRVARRCGAIPVLAVLFKRRGWKFVELKKIPRIVKFE
jgi:Holliday junction resolvase